MPGDRHKSQLKLRGKVSRKHSAQGGQCVAQPPARAPHRSTGGQILTSLTPVWVRSNSSNFDSHVMRFGISICTGKPTFKSIDASSLWLEAWCFIPRGCRRCCKSWPLPWSPKKGAVGQPLAPKYGFECWCLHLSSEWTWFQISAGFGYRCQLLSNGGWGEDGVTILGSHLRFDPCLEHRLP